LITSDHEVILAVRNNLPSITHVDPLYTPHECIRGMAVDLSGAHGLSCRKSAGRVARHTAINSIFKAALSAAEILSRPEPRGLARDDGKRSDGVTSMPWKNGRC